MRVHLVDGTYELFRQHFGAASRHSNSHPMAAAAGVVTSTLGLIEDGATPVGIASDHVIESFRNDLYAGYKTGEGLELLLDEGVEGCVDALGHDQLCVLDGVAEPELGGTAL